MKQNSDNSNYLIALDDLEEKAKLPREVLEDRLEKEKEKKKEFYHDLQEINRILNSPYHYLHNKVIDALLKKRGSILPQDFQGKGLEGLTFGFDSPEVQRAMAPQPIYLSQGEINRLAGVASGRVLGLYNPMQDKIYLVDSLAPAEKEEVYFHENVHRDHLDWSEGEVRDYVATQGYHIFH